jgi:uncharacterized damage-inducible protein DinB
MKNVFLVFARYNEEADAAVLSVMNGLSDEERTKNRGSYYGSLAGLTRHLFGGTSLFLGLFKGALGGGHPALKTLAPLEALSPVPEDKLTGDRWKTLAGAVKIADKALVDFTGALSDADFNLPLKVEWYGGKPPSVPLSFMFQGLTLHGTHHRGQISQVLDSLKIDNDYSRLSPAFLPR